MEVEEFPDRTYEPLYLSLDLLVQVGQLLAPKAVHRALAEHARHLQDTTSRNTGFKAEARMMRALQDGIDFGKWPGARK